MAGIELKGMNASAINRRKSRAEPVLERYNFIPNEISLTLTESIRINVQIMLENLASTKIKAIELIQEDVKNDYIPISPLLLDVLGDIPLLQPEVSIYTNKNMEIENVVVDDKELNNETAAYMICGSNLLSLPKILENTFASTRDGGFVLSRESLDFIANGQQEDIAILALHRTDSETLVLLRKKTIDLKYKTFDFTSSTKSFDWISALQNAIKSNEGVVLYAENDDLSGILGFVNCLRREQSVQKLRCIFIKDRRAPPFDPQLDFYKNQLNKGMAINVYENGSWGTYRHLLLDDNNEIESERCFATNTVMGDLNSLKWIEMPPKNEDSFLSKVNVSAIKLFTTCQLNSRTSFRYIMRR